MKANTERDFWAKVTIRPGCWLWTAGYFDSGYGAFSFEGDLWRAHRAAWEFIRGPIPEGAWVLHKCDNPPCVRPSHLFLGNPASNMEDKVRKGRQAHVRGHHKLTEHEVVDVRTLHAFGASQDDLAAAFGVSQGCVSMAINRVTWAGVP